MKHLELHLNRTRTHIRRITCELTAEEKAVYLNSLILDLEQERDRLEDIELPPPANDHIGI